MADKKITLNLKVLAAPDFYLSADAATKNVTVGGTVAFEIAVNPLAGFSGNVLLNLTPSQWPAGISASFNRSVVPAGETAILTIVVAADAMLVDFNFDVTPTI